jgi:hypothetical protein
MKDVREMTTELLKHLMTVEMPLERYVQVRDELKRRTKND